MEVSKLAAQKFLYTGLVAAVAPPLVLASFSNLIDTPWSLAMDRAVKVGENLGSRVQGIGFWRWICVR